MTKLSQKMNTVALGGPTLLMALTFAGCGGTMAFQGDKAFSVTGSQPVVVPAPAPPKAEPAPKRVNVRKNKIEIDEKVQFEHDKATILPVSHGLLDEVARVITENPQILKVLVEGHASSDGDAKHNMELSTERAKAVMDYLTTHGIDKKRLTSKGFGSNQPIADNATAEGREKNRRVEFTIQSMARNVAGGESK